MDYETPLFYRVMEYARAADRDVIDLVSGSPDWDPPEAFRDGLREYADTDQSAFDYGPSPGLHRLRQQIADHHGVSIERVVVTNGTGEANHLAMATGLERFPGNEVVLTDPVYPYYAGRTNLLDAESRFVPVDADDRLDPETLRAAVSATTSVIVVNTPNNPTGGVYDGSAMGKFVDIARTNDALLVSDEVYNRFDYSGRFSSALAADSTGSGPNVVVTSAFSKSMAITGARVGYGLFPTGDTENAGGSVEGAAGNPPDESFVDRVRSRHMLMNVTGSRPVQYAVSRAIEETPASYYERNRQRMADRIDRFCNALDALGAQYHRPDGAFYVLADLPGIGGSLEDAFGLIDEAGVAAMPGEAFGQARADHLRFSLLTPRYEAAVERIADALDRR